MDRRTLIARTTLGPLAAPLAAATQQAVEVWKIGFLSDSSPLAFPIHPGMNFRRLGHVEGQNIAIESRSSK